MSYSDEPRIIRAAGRAPAIPSLAAMLMSIPPEQLLAAPVVDVPNREVAQMTQIRSRFAGRRFCRNDVAAALGIHENRAAYLVQKLIMAGMAAHVETQRGGRKIYKLRGERE
ncbi:hypothetical protein CEK28_04975 [Xenophilus sp. AP218F]|nr:hypothetical protein CEK28_04975 [Xenophilus sp. AP218F]